MRHQVHVKEASNLVLARRRGMRPNSNFTETTCVWFQTVSTCQLFGGLADAIVVELGHSGHSTDWLRDLRLPTILAFMEEISQTTGKLPKHSHTKNNRHFFGPRV
jgi:hypothetical protein